MAGVNGRIGDLLCRVDLTLEVGAPLALGQSPWRNRRVSNIAGGVFAGDRLRGNVRPGGGDWTEMGLNAEGDALTLIDARTVWTTEDGAELYVTYQGRLVIPAAVLPEFRDPAKVNAVTPDRYYFRTTPLFETSDKRYTWLNALVALGVGQRTATGVHYDIYAIA